MRKPIQIISLLLIFVMLAACGKAPGETTVPTTEPVVTTESAETTLPPETTAPPETTVPPETTAPTEPTLPWEQSEGLGLSYEEYFSQNRQYELSVNIDRGWQCNTHYLRYQEDMLCVFGRGKYSGLLHVIPNADPSVELVACDSNWIYGIRNGMELIRIDYWWENEEVLFYDGIHSLEGLYHDFYFLAEETVLFFGACSDQGSIICRLFLPDMTLDIIAESDAPCVQQGGPPSNHEVPWYEKNVEFYEIVNGMTEEELEKYGSDSDYKDRISADIKVPMGFYHYVNTATGEEYTLNYYGVYRSERSREDIAANGDEWWKDFA